jgi:protein-S-isoprenylcysteine O-methyltransferase Ste14
MSSDPSDNAGVIAFPPLILAAYVAMGGIAHWLHPISMLPVLPARMMGVLLLIVAGAQAWWAAHTMKRAGTNVRPSLPTTAIVVAGPYTYTRNPMYLSLCVVFTGLSLLGNGALFLLFLPFLALTLHFGVIKREERYLTAKFGEGYLAYQRRVRRWI